MIGGYSVETWLAADQFASQQASAVALDEYVAADVHIKEISVARWLETYGEIHRRPT